MLGALTSDPSARSTVRLNLGSRSSLAVRQKSIGGALLSPNFRVRAAPDRVAGLVDVTGNKTATRLSRGFPAAEKELTFTLWSWLTTCAETWLSTAPGSCARASDLFFFFVHALDNKPWRIFDVSINPEGLTITKRDRNSMAALMKRPPVSSSRSSSYIPTIHFDPQRTDQVRGREKKSYLKDGWVQPSSIKSSKLF